MKTLSLLVATLALGLAANTAEAGGYPAYFATSTSPTPVPSTAGTFATVESITVRAGFYTIVANAQVQYTGTINAFVNCVLFAGVNQLPGSGGMVSLGYSNNVPFGSEAAVSAYYATAATTISLQCQQPIVPVGAGTGVTIQPGASLLITKVQTIVF